MHGGGLKIRKKVQFREVSLLLVICGDRATTRVPHILYYFPFLAHLCMYGASVKAY